MQATPAAPRVTGMGVISPIGGDLHSFWNGLIAGHQAAEEIRSFDTSTLKNRIGCEIHGFELADEMQPYLLGGRCTELAMAAAGQAVADAGLQGQIDGAQDVGVVVGTTM